ncbi:MAG: glycosyltransferase family 39 protein, partial [Anaerolineae bacterium]|nr:glycosyltransferase family 39 protein [Anaerolineae bacterium]
MSTPARAPRKPFSRGMLAALALMIFAFLAAAVVSRTVFERLPHLEDEFAYLYQARIFARGQVWVERDEPVKVFWQPFVLQPEEPVDGALRRFGKYIPGWPLVLTPGIWMGQPWVINAFLAMLSVGLVYRLGKEIFSEPAGLVAALLTAISPVALLLNATLMSHTWAMFAALVFTYSYWRTLKRGRGRYLWAALGGLM